MSREKCPFCEAPLRRNTANTSWLCGTEEIENDVEGLVYFRISNVRTRFWYVTDKLSTDQAREKNWGFDSLGTCFMCNGPMSPNPHPEAGTPTGMLEYGTTYVCIPCTHKKSHDRLEKLRRIKEALSGVIDWFMEDPHMLPDEDIDLVELAKTVADALEEDRRDLLRCNTHIRNALRMLTSLANVDDDTISKVVSELRNANDSASGRHNRKEGKQ